LGFVVLPKPKIDGAMLDSTWLTLKTREEQQQVPPKVLFYQSTKNISHKNFLQPYHLKHKNSRYQQTRDKAER
jgi:hypothetical protein